MGKKLKNDLITAIESTGMQYPKTDNVYKAIAPVVDSAIEEAKNRSLAAHKRHSNTQGEQEKKCSPVICEIKMGMHELHQKHLELFEASKALVAGDLKPWREYRLKYGE